MKDKESNGYTPTQQKMLGVLADGRSHTREELHECCGPSSKTVIQQHIHYIRKKLRPRGEDIICTLVSRKICYQHVRLLASAVDGTN